MNKGPLTSLEITPIYKPFIFWIWRDILNVLRWLIGKPPLPPFNTAP